MDVQLGDTQTLPLHFCGNSSKVWRWKKHTALLPMREEKRAWRVRQLQENRAQDTQVFPRVPASPRAAGGLVCTELRGSAGAEGPERTRRHWGDPVALRGSCGIEGPERTGRHWGAPPAERKRCRLTLPARPTPLPRRRLWRQWRPLRRAGIRPRPLSPRRPPAPQVSARGCRGSQPPLPLPGVVAKGRRGSGRRLPAAAEGLGQSRRAVRAERSLSGHGRAPSRPAPLASHGQLPQFGVCTAGPERPCQGTLFGSSPASSPASSRSCGFSPVKGGLLYRPPVPLSRSPGKMNQPRIYPLTGFPGALGRSTCSLCSLFLGSATLYPRLHRTPEAFLELSCAPG